MRNSTRSLRLAFFRRKPRRIIGRRPFSTTALPEIVLQPTEDDLAEAFRPFYETQQPVILRHAMNDSMAVKHWEDLDYLAERVDPDYVCDVEAGPYNRGEKLTIRFDQYVDYLRLWKVMYDTNNNKEEEESPPKTPDEHLLYLAQNDLPAGLLQDIPIPSVCTDPSFGAGKLYSTMLWMGPAATLSPLHFDPLANFLMQVVGRKRVMLLPADTDPTRLYAGEAWRQQHNTSAVDDLESPDVLTNFPLFETAQKDLLSGLLHPGDILYIPAKWWHAVKSLDYSISVNAWWR